MAGIFYFEEDVMTINELQVKMRVSLIGTGKCMWKLKVVAFVASVLGNTKEKQSVFKSLLFGAV